MTLQKTTQSQLLERINLCTRFDFTISNHYTTLLSLVSVYIMVSQSASQTQKNSYTGCTLKHIHLFSMY